MPFHPAETSRLKNGARLITVPSHDTQAVTVLVLFEVGSRYESHKLSGASHFVEHMMFKGTKKRPTSAHITRDLDSVGADYNAFTGKDYTGYYIRLNAERWELAVDMLHDMLFRSTYKAEECERECGVIIEEINMYEDNPIMHAEELLEQEIYAGSSLGRNIAGTPTTMRGISRTMLTKYRDEYYVPSRMVVAVAGRIDPKLRAMLEETFGAVKEPKRASRAFAKATMKTGRPKFTLKTKETEQVQFTLGFPGFPYGHPKLATLSLISTILGGGMSSRLFTEVRERRGLAYSVRASLSPYQDVGNIAIQAGLMKAKLNQGIATIFKEIGKLASSGATAEELTRAKEYIKGRMVLGLEESSALAEFYAKQELLQRKLHTPEERMARLEKVTAADIKAVAREVFRTPKISAALIGPFKDPAPFRKLLVVPK